MQRSRITVVLSEKVQITNTKQIFVHINFCIKFSKYITIGFVTLFLARGAYLWAYQLFCSQTDLATDLPIVCKFKFVRYVNIKRKVAP